MQAMSNTAKCQLSRAVHSSNGLADAVRVVGEPELQGQRIGWKLTMLAWAAGCLSPTPD